MGDNDEDHIEPTETALELTKRVACEMATLLDGNCTGATIQDEGILIYMKYRETWGYGGEMTHEYDALLPWNTILNGDVCQWAWKAQSDYVQECDDKLRFQKKQNEDEAKMRVEGNTKRQREKDVETYERIRKEKETS